MVTRSLIILGAVALLVAATPTPAALAGAVPIGAAHDYVHFGSSSRQGDGGAAITQGAIKPAISRCHRVCVKTKSHGTAAAPECIEWRTIC
jgi:hypothetical protein